MTDYGRSMVGAVRFGLVVVVLLAPLAAAAQAGSRYHPFRVDYTHGSPVEGTDSSGLLALGALAAIGALGIAMLGSGRGAGPASAGRHVAGASRWRGVDVVSLRLVVRGPLGTIREGGPAPADPSEVRGAAAALRRARREWSHAGGTSYRPMSEAMADAAYARHVESAQAATAADGRGDAYRSAADPILVTLTVAARTEIPDFQPGQAGELDRTLQALENLANASLVAASIGSRPIAAAELAAGASTLAVIAAAEPATGRTRPPAARRLVVR